MIKTDVNVMITRIKNIPSFSDPLVLTEGVRKVMDASSAKDTSEIDFGSFTAEDIEIVMDMEYPHLQLLQNLEEFIIKLVESDAIQEKNNVCFL